MELVGKRSRAEFHRPRTYLKKEETFFQIEWERFWDEGYRLVSLWMDPKIGNRESTRWQIERFWNVNEIWRTSAWKIENPTNKT